MNHALVGRTYPGPRPFDVSRQKLLEFADAIGETHPVLRDVDAAREAGHRDLPAAPTFPAVVALHLGLGPRTDPELELDYARIVHGEQRIEAERPIYAGDVLRAETTIEGIRDAGSNELLTLVCRISTEAGEAVSTVTSVLVSRGTAGGAR